MQFISLVKEISMTEAVLYVSTNLENFLKAWKKESRVGVRAAYLVPDIYVQISSVGLEIPVLLDICIWH